MAVLVLCIAAFFFESIHWPMLGDASLIHYVVFLMGRGVAPYRDIAEINLPGSYLVEWAAVHLFGGSAVGWRLFDFALMLLGVAAMVVITLPFDWFAGFWAGAVFLLIHGRDGLLQLGQRDLTAAVCLLVGYALLFLGLRLERAWLVFGFGLAAGLAATIKPTLLPIGVLSLLVVYLQLRREGKPCWRFVGSGAAGLMLPWVGVAVFLWRMGAARAFLEVTIGMMAYHASLGRRAIGYLLLHSVSPLLPLVAILVLVLALRRRRPSWESVHLWIGMGFGLLSYLSQAKGYSYQRYPFVAFLLLVMAIEFSAALGGKRVVKALGVLGLAFGSLYLAPVSTAMASRYDWKSEGTVGMLERDLRALGAAKLAGGVQCVDSIDGCVAVLDRMKVVETSAVFYDEFLFGPASVRAIEESREKFWRDLEACPPSVIVVTERLFPSGPDHYGKLGLWPEFDVSLTRDYSLEVERTPTVPVRWWSRAEVPAGYRIYVRDSAEACRVAKGS